MLEVARGAIRSIFNSDRIQPPDLSQYDDHLVRRGACFVTLEVNGVLQGCIGSIAPREPLVMDVFEKACASALQDRRFAPLTEEQLGGLTIEVSVLNPPEIIQVDSELALVEHLKSYPKNDRPGLIMAEFLSGQPRQAVFLPQVWSHLPDPQDFITQLKFKAGWDEDYWSSDLVVKIFTVSSVKEAY
ncbi:AmmeMemoRadiSam system protein A [Vibrio quintilis]|uniref:AmmeMemoRadiSam system protein A n=1 Tax=Vibrio quintilis TaxID=1117707 RepID=UPI0021C8345F|nr:AmmeMemoRadiSam system protein A [Vibrio quintilis]